MTTSEDYIAVLTGGGSHMLAVQQAVLDAAGITKAFLARRKGADS